VKKSIGDILSDGFSLFGRMWKPLVLGFGVLNLFGAVPGWAFSLGQEKLYASLAAEASPGMSSLLKALPALQLIVAGGFMAVIVYVLAYNFAIAMAQSTFMARDPQNVGEVTAFSFRLFFPAMGSLGWFGLVYLVPITLFCLSLFFAYQGFQGGGWAGAVALFVAAFGIRLMCAPFLLLVCIVPVSIGRQGREALKKALEFVGENVGELMVMALIVLGITLGGALLSTILEAPLPSAPDNVSMNDVLGMNSKTAIDMLLKPSAEPFWSSTVKLLIEVGTSVLAQALSVCLVATWFCTRTGVSPEAWPKISA